VPFGFVEDIHVSSNTCKDVQACANTGSVSDEKRQNVQAHASLSKDLAGSLRATVYRMCEQRELPHFRVRNAIRVPVPALLDYLEARRRRSR